MLKKFSFVINQFLRRNISMKRGPYRSIFLNGNDLIHNSREEIDVYLAKAKDDGYKSIFVVDLPMLNEKSNDLLKYLMKLDPPFRLHHAHSTSLTLLQWLRKRACAVPPYATHRVGAAGLVIDKKKHRLLLVREKTSLVNGWKLPGGTIDLNEQLSDGVKREVMEETGISTQFLSVIGFRHLHNFPYAFGISDFYFLCHLRATTFDIQIAPTEIEKCEWHSFDDINNIELTPGTKEIMRPVQYHNFNLNKLVQFPSSEIIPRKIRLFDDEEEINYSYRWYYQKSL
ncbi:hypothetical protein SNEBB_001901 [Seison nebaliae]|nr:hypothetical protein SNEBB_001901 [Seison nebaliae]